MGEGADGGTGLSAEIAALVDLWAMDCLLTEPHHPEFMVMAEAVYESFFTWLAMHSPNFLSVLLDVDVNLDRSLILNEIGWTMQCTGAVAVGNPAGWLGVIVVGPK